MNIIDKIKFRLMKKEAMKQIDTELFSRIICLSNSIMDTYRLDDEGVEWAEDMRADFEEELKPYIEKALKLSGNLLRFMLSITIVGEEAMYYSDLEEIMFGCVDVIGDILDREFELDEMEFMVETFNTLIEPIF